MSFRREKADTLDRTVAFLAKRDGIDKTLKILRYAAKLGLATSLDGGKFTKELSSLESSIGTSRKAYRLGKFLQNVNAARKVQTQHSHALLELVANAGECIYYFVDQFQWLVKTGIIPARFGPQLTRVSASGELLGYSASVILAVLRLHYLLEREVALIAELQRRRRARAAYGSSSTVSGEDDEKDDALLSEIRQLRARRALRTLGLAQDLADALLALADLRGDASAAAAGGGSGRSAGMLNNRALLAIAGLVSGCISAYKNWPGNVV